MTLAGSVKRIDRMLGVTIAASIGIVLAVLVGFDVLLTLINEFQDLGDGDYNLPSALVYVAYTVPRRIHENFVHAAVIGTLLGLGILASHGEITAMRAAGLAKRRIALSAVGTVGVLALAIFLLGETLAPEGERWAQALHVQAKHRDYALSRETGMWARDGDTVVNAKSVMIADGQLQMRDVRLFFFEPSGRLDAITRSETAIHKNGAWRLENVRRFAFGETNVEPSVLANEDWTSTLDPEIVSQGAIRERYQSMGALWENYRYLKSNRLNTREVESAFWTRLFSPLGTLALVFAVTPFAFGALRSGGAGKRLFLGIVIAVSAYFLQRALVNLAVVYDYNLPLINALPPLLLAAVGWLYYKHCA
jgi:lipopolysaccharide export system permease protein